ncbi:MAG: TetR/AcrR family transcriptional regulator [Steroidobacteraceae bacterium]|jgi:AcrR family transcriptional regulator|nr:TetR/AcrR family transcriptional regulator [Steroidobacteraceae bacterium]
MRAALEARPAGADAPGVRFLDVLAERQRRAPAPRKGERTRNRLKLAAVHALEQRGYLQLRVTDICRRARVSDAVFYVYFENKVQITVEVLSEFLDHTFELGESPDPKPRRSLFEALEHANLRWISAVRANAGLTRCLLQFADQVPEFRELSSRRNHQWYLHVTRRLLARLGARDFDESAPLLAVHVLGGMIDELCSKVFVSREPHVVALVDSIVPTDAALAEFVSILWYRGLFGREPIEARHPAGRALQRLADLRSAESGQP